MHSGDPYMERISETFIKSMELIKLSGFFEPNKEIVKAFIIKYIENLRVVLYTFFMYPPVPLTTLLQYYTLKSFSSKK